MDSLEVKIEKFLSVGYGYGDGYGYGNGDGDGNGDGNGNGYGDGYGDGDGDGDGILEINGHKTHNIDGVPTCITQVHGTRYAVGFIIKQNSIEMPCYIAKVDNFFAHGKTLREAVNDAQAKALQAKPIEERIKEVVKLHPQLDVPISNKELFALHYTATRKRIWNRIKPIKCMSGYRDNLQFGELFGFKDNAERKLAAHDCRLKNAEADIDKLQRDIISLRAKKFPTQTDDDTIFALQQELYRLKSQLSQIQQYIFLCNRKYTDVMDFTTKSSTDQTAAARQGSSFAPATTPAPTTTRKQQRQTRRKSAAPTTSTTTTSRRENTENKNKEPWQRK